MRLVSFQLRNFMSFSDTGSVRFSNGFNVIVGQNNAGKSALLQGISLRFGDKPHLSLQTKPTSTTPVSPQSEALFSLECDGQELRTILLNRGSEFGIPVPAGGTPNSIHHIDAFAGNNTGGAATDIVGDSLVGWREHSGANGGKQNQQSPVGAS